MKAERIAGKTVADGYASAREPVSVAMACVVNVRFGKLQ